MESNELKQSLIRLPEVIKRTGLSRSTIYSYINQDIFPKPVNIGLRAVGWHEAEINNWIANRKRNEA